MLTTRKYTENFQELLQELKTYLGLQKKYVSMDAADKLTVLLSAVSVVSICILVGSMILFFATFALAQWIGDLANSQPIGFLTIAGVLFIGLLVLYRNRGKWILRPIARLMVSIFIDKEDEEEEETANDQI